MKGSLEDVRVDKYVRDSGLTGITKTLHWSILKVNYHYPDMRNSRSRLCCATLRLFFNDTLQQGGTTRLYRLKISPLIVQVCYTIEKRKIVYCVSLRYTNLLTNLLFHLLNRCLLKRIDNKPFKPKYMNVEFIPQWNSNAMYLSSHYLATRGKPLAHHFTLFC